MQVLQRRRLSSSETRSVYRYMVVGCRGRWILGYLGKGIQTTIARGRFTKVISMIKWIRTSGLSIKNYLSGSGVCWAVGLGPKRF